MTETKLSGTILDGESRPEGRGAGTEPRRSVVTECDLPQAPDKVWRALTVPKLLEAWLPDAIKSEILEAEPNRLLRYRWPGNEQDKDAQGRTLESVVTFELTGTEAGGTHLRVEHRLAQESNILPFRGPRTVAMARDSGLLHAPGSLMSGSGGVEALRVASLRTRCVLASGTQALKVAA